MARCPTLAKRFGLLAALFAFAFAWTTEQHADRRLASTARDSFSHSTRTASFVATSLPRSLQPPSIDLARTFLSLIAADIDADGDLDVVGIDEFRALVVWENDGTGRLTRKQPTEPNGSGARSSLPWIDDQQTTSRASVQHRTAPLDVSMARCADACGFLPGFNLIVTGPQSLSVSINSPRAPPASAV